MKARVPVLWLLLGCSLLCVTSARGQNPIQLENAKAGTTAWILSNYAANHQIEGYANLTSVNRGGQIQFFVNTIDNNFTIQIFRMGWYGGAGSRKITDPVQVPGTAQPPCSNDKVTGLIECNWINPYTLQIPNNTSDPTDWCSGVYVAKLAGAGGFQSYIVFVVRDDKRSSDLLFQSSVNTYQAYNNWGGRSLYAYNSDFQARKVSFNRPYVDSQGAGQFFGKSEYAAVRFLEREGYDVTYATDVDVHENANLVSTHKADLIWGHGEYWSWEIRANVLAALAKGISLGVFAANTCYWQVRYEPSTAGGVADRTMVGYKDAALTQDPDYTGGNTSLYHLVTTNWRAFPVSLPEDAFIGVMYGDVVTTGDIVVTNASSWVFNNTGLTNGSHLTNLMGDEVDSLAPDTPPGTVQLAHSPYQISGTTRFADMTVYTNSSGATVFAAGTIIWSWGIDNFGGRTPIPAAQQITRNVLAKFIGTASSVVLSSVSLNPNSVAGGNSSSGTVTLSGVAPSGGAAVTLTSSDTSAAQVPASVTVSAGSATSTFTVNTSSVSSATSVTITGAFNGSATARLTVNAPAVLTLSSVTLSPATVNAASSSTGTVTLSAPAPSGGATLTLASNDSSAAQVPASVTVPAGAASTTFTVSTGSVATSTMVTITASYSGGTRTARLTINPLQAVIALSPATLTFSAEPLQTTSPSQSVTVTNSGNAPATISSISINGANPADFKTGSNNCGNSLAVGANCIISVTFAPGALGARAATLSIVDNAVQSPQIVNLSGTGSGFALAVSGQASQTVTAGQTASFNLTVQSTSFSGTVTIACSGAPAGATCASSPNSVTLTGSNTVPITVSISTTARTGLFPWTVTAAFPQTLWLCALALALSLLSLPGLRTVGLSMNGSGQPRQAVNPLFAVLALLLIASIGCGGTIPNSSSAPKTPSTTGTSASTSASTSTITVTATSGSTQSTVPLTLTVN